MFGFFFHFLSKYTLQLVFLILHIAHMHIHECVFVAITNKNDSFLYMRMRVYTKLKKFFLLHIIIIYIIDARHQD
jgi:hypothetical protein